MLHVRIPGAESEMSVFSNNEAPNANTKLPDISRSNTNQHASSALKNKNPNIQEILSPTSMGNDNVENSPLRRSYSPSKTFFSGY